MKETVKYVSVHNLKGTTDKRPDSGSWIEKWESKTGRTATKCSRIDCKNKNDLVGAHVQKDCIIDRHWYIIPLCKECNNINNKDSFNVPASALVLLSEIKSVNEESDKSLQEFNSIFLDDDCF